MNLNLGHRKVVKSLVEKGANIKVLDKLGKNAEDLASSNSKEIFVFH